MFSRRPRRPHTFTKRAPTQRNQNPLQPLLGITVTALNAMCCRFKKQRNCAIKCTVTVSLVHFAPNPHMFKQMGFTAKQAFVSHFTNLAIAILGNQRLNDCSLEGQENYGNY